MLPFLGGGTRKIKLQPNARRYGRCNRPLVAVDVARLQCHGASGCDAKLRCAAVGSAGVIISQGTPAGL
jgi:hypothetical protein